MPFEEGCQYKIKRRHALYRECMRQTLEIRTCWALFMVIALCKWLLMTLLLLSYDTWWIIIWIEHIWNPFWTYEVDTRYARQVKILKNCFIIQSWSSLNYDLLYIRTLIPFNAKMSIDYCQNLPSIYDWSFD